MWKHRISEQQATKCASSKDGSCERSLREGSVRKHDHGDHRDDVSFCTKVNSILSHGCNHRVTANRKFNLFVVAVSAFSSLILLLYRNIKDAVGLLRALMAISTTRLLALTPGMFSLVYSLVATMFFIKPYMMITLITMYLYSAAAYFCFGGTTDFATMFDSFITMFQLLIGEGWHEVMYNQANSSNRLHAHFFMSYVFIVGVLLSQLFIGLVISLYEQYKALRKNGDLYMELAFTQSRENRNPEMLQKLIHELVELGIVKDSESKSSKQLMTATHLDETVDPTNQL